MIALPQRNAIYFKGELAMRLGMVLAVLLLGSGAGYAKKAKEPLPDYVGRFKELDAQLRAIDASDPACTNYIQWMESAIECKRKLRLWNQIDPWLDGLSATASNNWKKCHAVAVGHGLAGHREEDERWKAIGLMDRAYRQAVTEQATGQELGALIEDYIDLLLIGRDHHSFMLLLKTVDLSQEEASYRKSVDGKSAEDLVFFDCPDSYASAANDGELMRWLIQKSMPPSYVGTHWLSPRGMADFAVLLAGVHRSPYLGEREFGIWEKHHALADDETMVWHFYRELEPVQLPKDYRYIPIYRKLAEEGDQTAVLTLGMIFSNRHQLERSAHYFELAGKTNLVRSIRAKQGKFRGCPAQAANKPATIDYAFRNGTEVGIEVFRIEAETNLLAQLRAGTLPEKKLELLEGSPESYRDSGMFDLPCVAHADDRVAAWTVPLDPHPDHWDCIQEIKIPVLEEGNYLVRATMKDGNMSETILNLFNTLVFFGKMEGDEVDEFQPFFLFCDAATGKPKGDQIFYLVDLIRNYSRKKNNLKPYVFYTIQKGITDQKGLCVFDNTDYLAGSHLLFGQETRNLSAYGVPYLDYYRMRDSRCARNFFAVTDRPIYRPGDTGFLKLAFPPDDREPLSIQLKAPSGKSAITFEVDGASEKILEVEPDGFGGADGCFKIPENAKLGTWQVRQLGCSGYQDWATRFEVEEYRAPTFKISAKLLPSGKMSIGADYTYGQPVAGGKVQVEVSFFPTRPDAWYPASKYDFRLGRGYAWHGGQFGRSPLDAFPKLEELSLDLSKTLNTNGLLEVDLSRFKALSAFKLPGYFRAEVEVVDAAEKRVEEGFNLFSPVAKRKVCCWLEKAFYDPSENPECHIAMQRPLGEVGLELSQVVGTNILFLKRFERVGETVELGYLSSGLYEVKAMAEGGEASQPFRFTVLGGKPEGLSAQKPIRVVREKGSHESGSSAQVLIQTDRPGRYVYFFQRVIDGDTFSEPAVYHMDSTEKVVEVCFGDKEAGYVSCAAMVVEDAQSRFSGCVIPVIDPTLPVGRVEIEPDRKTYRPGDTATVDLQALDSENKGHPCSITVSVYNQALDLIADDFSTDIRHILFSNWSLYPRGEVFLEDNWPRGSIWSKNPKWVMNQTFRSDNLPIEGGRFFYKELAVFGSGLAISGGVDCFGKAPNQSDSKPSAPQAVPEIRKDFRDSAYWNATVETDAEGRATVEFPMPDSLAEWKILAWAINTNFAGSGTASIQCAKDFVVQLNLPRFMVEGDEVEISTSLRNHTTNAIDAVATCTASGSALRVESPGKVAVQSLEPGSEQMLYWNTKAVGSGVSTVTVSAQGEHDADGMEKPVPVFSHTMLKRGGNGGVLAGKIREEQVEIEIPDAVDTDSIRLELDCSPNMLGALAGALPYLAEYPHGCTEQTLNRFLPAVVVLQTMGKLGLELEPSTVKMPEGREAVLDAAEILKLAQKGIDRLEEAKRYDGWGWMPGAYSIDSVVSAWVVRGLHIAAQNPELEVNRKKVARGLSDLVDRMEKVLKSGTDEHVRNSDALAAVVCAEIGLETYSDQLSWLSKKSNVVSRFSARLLEKADELSLYGKVLLAYAFELRGETQQRDRLVKFIEQYLENDPDLGTYWLRTGSEGWWYWYNDQIETLAWYLKLLNRLEPHSEKTAGVVRYLMQNRIHGDHWKSTRDTAICIEALCEFAENNRSESTSPAYRVSLNGKPVPHSETGTYSFSELKPGRNLLRLQSTDGQPLFFDATWQYRTRENPIASEKCDLVSVLRSYHRIDPTTGKAEEDPLAPGAVLKAGETVEAELLLESSQKLEYLLAEDFKPSGFECLEDQSGRGYGDGVSYYRELHDERVSFYIHRLSKGTATIRYRMRAEHAGTMAALPSTIELMYAPRQAANSAETQLRVVR